MTACVVSGHPFLRNWVIEERDFDTGENTPTALNGHGTSVAGLVIYGSIAECLENRKWEPKVNICSAKVWRNAPDWGAIIPDEHRAEKITEDAIRYFAKERQCKVFNLSLENEGEVYRGGRQFPWAEKLDELARELDIVIVLITGNRSDPPLPEKVYTREQFQKAILKQILDDQDQRICNPGTAALALTVGALARSDALGHHEQYGGLRLKDALPGAPANAPAPFTRTGTGYSFGSTNGAIKPDLVDYGGNAAIQVIAGLKPRWVSNHILLGEPTLSLEKNGRFIGACAGTSFASPHVAHAAAIAAASLETAIKQKPSANLIRALVGSASVSPPCPQDWLGDEEETLRLVGYGMCSVDDLTWSKRNRVRLVAMDEIEVDKLHIYRVAIPDIFLSTPGRRGITVALAYDPPVRAIRKEYLANNMGVEALQGLTAQEVERYRSRRTAEDTGNLPSGAEIDMRPSKTRLQWSTLQVRRKEWKRKPALRIPTGETEPVIHFVIGCQQRFPTGLDIKQGYGLVVLFWHEAEQIELYQSLQNRVTLRATRLRVTV
ncbi:S8 family peptidase [Microseira wollei]|uniref:Peptidase S8 and S53, subtilisin, kexin, sedolisin n=1 Tax=Microseira wollei NIES-4236 TaxID=2530354 RepID=A0AAV3XQ96_9CYAN|nr:S8 family peptidase [Microseira wollei]GET43926.1 peptidase S8 and S53, subtilisin, kexin, sedolisin [Microseira wollei NIES-4236]